jgi:sugar O-acyltransferase (sialic acid O-acetyltransferase NeuD family)
MTKIIIFGTEQTAELATYYIKNDTEHEVCGYTMSSSRITEDKFMGMPVYDFEHLDKTISTTEYSLFAPMMPSKVNKDREKIYNIGHALGFKFITYISSKATVLTKNIGDNCFILENNTIQPFAKIGNNTIIWSGNHVGHHSTIGNSVFISSHCVISGNCTIKDYSYLGVNSTIVDNCTFEESCMLTMGSNLTSKRTKTGCVYTGNPAREHSRLKSHHLLK